MLCGPLLLFVCACVRAVSSCSPSVLVCVCLCTCVHVTPCTNCAWLVIFKSGRVSCCCSKLSLLDWRNPSSWIPAKSKFVPLDWRHQAWSALALQTHQTQEQSRENSIVSQPVGAVAVLVKSLLFWDYCATAEARDVTAQAARNDCSRGRSSCCLHGVDGFCKFISCLFPWDDYPCLAVCPAGPPGPAFATRQVL